MVRCAHEGMLPCAIEPAPGNYLPKVVTALVQELLKMIPSRFEGRDDFALLFVSRLLFFCHEDIIRPCFQLLKT